MMAYEIYTFGNGEVLSGVFNSIAMCMNGDTGTLFEPLKRMALILGTFWAAVSALGGDQARVLTHWIVPMAIFMNVLFVPTTSVWIHDPITHYHQKVDNVPHGLAAFASYTSKIGYHITEEVEKVFTLPDDLRYQKSGSLFASNIMQKAKSFHITNADLEENMRSFVGQCVLYDAMLGRKYTIDDLRNTDDIWGLISENPSPVRSFLWRDPKEGDAPRGRPDIISCAEGVAKINHLWALELDRSANLFGKKIFGKNGLVNPKAELLKYLPIAYAQLGNIAKDASEIIKQQMMIYAVVEGVESNSTALGNAPNFAARRAYLQQRTTYETLGAMAGETLPIMKAVLEAIVYSFFLFVIPLSLLPSGYKYLMTWGQSLLWLQMWAPLYAVLNYIMTMAARSKTLDALSISNEAGVTIASSVGLANMNADITAMAGYLAMSIPFLSLALVKGVGSFVHMASHLGNVSQGAASMAANEVTSGNLSFGNVSQGNSQISNSSMLNHSNAASYKGSSAHIQDGRSEITTMADGSQVLNVGSSNLPVSLNVAESQSAQLSQMASQSTQKAMNLSESSAQNLSNSARSAVSLSENLSRLESSGDSASLGISTEQSKAIHHGANLTREFQQQNQIDEGKAAQLLANASFGTGKGGGLLGGSVSMGGDISAKEQELHTKAQKFAEDHNYQQAIRESANASKQISHSLTDESARRLSEDVSGSYETGMSQRSEASKSFRQAEDYSSQANFTSANSATINANHNQQFGEWLAAQPADNTNGGTIGARGASHIIAAKPQETMAYAQRYMAEKGLTPTNSVSSGSTSRSSYDQDQGHQVHAVTRDSLQNVRNQANDMTSVGSAARGAVEVAQSQHGQSISDESRSALDQGADLKRNVQAEQNKGVVRRLSGKGTKEISNMIDDVKNIKFGESQQK
jgi:conjugal transfer mating pair stabilization protein TraG